MEDQEEIREVCGGAEGGEGEGERGPLRVYMFSN